MYQVIIVDDEAKIRNGIAGLFPWSQLGFEIAGCFSNGKAAYEYTLANHVDLILSDIRMPIMDGLELSEKLLEKRTLKLSSSVATRTSSMSAGPCAPGSLTIC